MVFHIIGEQAVSRLRSLGLTMTEAEVYLALLKGDADAKSLSVSSGVPYSKMHTVLGGLVEKKLVVRIGRGPAIYSCREPGEALQDYKRMRIADLEEKIKEAEVELSKLRTEATSERPDIWIIKGQEKILMRSYDAINDAKVEAKVALPSFPQLLTSALVPVMKRLKAENIKIKLLLPSSVQPDDVKKLVAFGEVRLRDKMFGGGIIIDDREALLLVSAEGDTQNIAIWSNHLGIVQLAAAYFDNLWTSSFSAF